MHHEPPSALIFRISAFITFVLFVTLGAVVVFFVNERVKKLEQAWIPFGYQEPLDPANPVKPNLPTRSDAHALAPLWYILSFLFWPVALGCAMVFLQKRETARMGRVCAILGVVDILLIALATCVGVALVADYIPPDLVR